MEIVCFAGDPLAEYLAEVEMDGGEALVTADVTAEEKANFSRMITRVRRDWLKLYDYVKNPFECGTMMFLRMLPTFWIIGLSMSDLYYYLPCFALIFTAVRVWLFGITSYYLLMAIIFAFIFLLSVSNIPLLAKVVIYERLCMRSRRYSRLLTKSIRRIQEYELLSRGYRLSTTTKQLPPISRIESSSGITAETIRCRNLRQLVSQSLEGMIEQFQKFAVTELGIYKEIKVEPSASFDCNLLLKLKAMNSRWMDIWMDCELMIKYALENQNPPIKSSALKRLIIAADNEIRLLRSMETTGADISHLIGGDNDNESTGTVQNKHVLDLMGCLRILKLRMELLDDNFAEIDIKKICRDIENDLGDLKINWVALKDSLLKPEMDFERPATTNDSEFKSNLEYHCSTEKEIDDQIMDTKDEELQIFECDLSMVNGRDASQKPKLTRYERIALMKQQRIEEETMKQKRLAAKQVSEQMLQELKSVLDSKPR